MKLNKKMGLGALSLVFLVSFFALPWWGNQNLIKLDADPSTHVNVILYADSMKKSAEAFQKFHKDYESVQSILVSVDSIGNKGRSSDLKPTADGWENTRPKLNAIQNYKYELALKITDYLRDMAKKNKIDSVMVLGDAGLVPPSYYMYVDYEHDLKAPENIKEYTAWIATDLYYGAVDYTTNYKWAVGRVSVDNDAEAITYLEKLKAYKDIQKTDPSQHNIYGGSNVGFNQSYMGEMAYLALQDAGVFGNDINFYNESGNLFNKEVLLKAFKEENAAMHWIFSHGMGEGFVMSDNKQITVDDILKLPAKKHLPLVLSPSCLDAGFDYDLIRLPFARDIQKSVGEAILASKGAGIGYIGSARLALAGLDYQTEDKSGRVIVNGLSFMPDLILDFLKAYQGGKHRIGDAFVDAHNNYMKTKSDHSNPGFRAMYANYVLLGDPVLTLNKPPKFTQEKVQSVQFTNMDYVDEFSDDFKVPGFKVSNDRLAKRSVVHFTIPSSELSEMEYYILNVTDHKLEAKHEKMTAGSIHQFYPAAGKLYLLIGLTPNKRKIWQYFSIGEPSAD